MTNDITPLLPPSNAVRVLATGGTFDKRYDPVAGTLSFGDSHLPQALAQARLGVPVVLEVLMQVDSLEMGESQREAIRAACLRSAERSIVIIHGTDTLLETAQRLADLQAKTVVLTGAMVPLALEESDATFNLGYALACAELLPPGVYVAMGGQVWPWSSVRKNRDAARFETIGRDTAPRLGHNIA